MPAVQAVSFTPALWYDGTNAAEIQELATMNPVIIEDDGGTLILARVLGGPIECPPERWITFSAGNVYQVLTDEQFDRQFVIPATATP